MLNKPRFRFPKHFSEDKKWALVNSFSLHLWGVTPPRKRKTLIMIYDCLFKVYDPAQILPFANHLGWLYLGFGETHGQTSPKVVPFLFHLSQAMNYRQGLRLALTISYISKQSPTDLQKKSVLADVSNDRCSLFLPLWVLGLTYTSFLLEYAVSFSGWYFPDIRRVWLLDSYNKNWSVRETFSTLEV